MSTEGAPRYRRSPYLLLRWEGDQLVLLNANTRHHHAIQPGLVRFLSALGGWRTAETLAAEGYSIGDHELEQLREWGILDVKTDALTSDDGRFEWDPIELALQRRTASGGLASGVGTSAPPPARPRFIDRPCTSLPPPQEPESLLLTEALVRRRSIRNYAPRALRLDELSTLLHHSARVIEVQHDPHLGTRALRPFPTAGARSELEIYVVANEVEGLAAGAHYFEAMGHRLLAIRDRDEHQAKILRFVEAAAGDQLDRAPAVVLLITAVFERVMWKYRDLGLSLIYKDVGALMQTLYLVATALHIGPCAIGGGDELANSRWLGLDPLYESQVGCFLLGPAPAGEQPE